VRVAVIVKDLSWVSDVESVGERVTEVENEADSVDDLVSSIDKETVPEPSRVGERVAVRDTDTSSLIDSEPVMVMLELNVCSSVNVALRLGRDRVRDGVFDAVTSGDGECD
jgi:hypothetical protein